MKKNKIYTKMKEYPSLKVFLKHFLKERPVTYYKNGKEQCKANANRSFTDLMAICETRYEDVTIDKVMKGVIQSYKKGICYVVWCSQIKKWVLAKSTDYKGDFISDYSTKYHADKTGVDGISGNDLQQYKGKYY